MVRVFALGGLANAKIFRLRLTRPGAVPVTLRLHSLYVSLSRFLLVSFLVKVGYYLSRMFGIRNGVGKCAVTYVTDSTD